MPALFSVAMFFQDEVNLAHDVHSLMIAEWIIAGFVLLVLLGLLGAVVGVYLLVRKVEKKIEATTKTIQARAMPLIGQGQNIMGKVQEIVADLKPKIASVTDDVTHMSGVVKSKVDEIGEVVTKVVGEVSGTVTKVVGEVSETVTQVNGTVQDVNGKTKSQVQRVNGIVSDALAATENASRSIQHGIQVPIQKIVGWVATAKTSIEQLGDRMPFLNQMMGNKPEPKSSSTRPGTARPATTGGPALVSSTSTTDKF
ncbi:MAG: hypothetical protein ACRYFU_14225 [Janthinobacterium lividum]